MKSTWSCQTRFIEALDAFLGGNWWGDKDALFTRTKNRVCFGPLDFWRPSPAPKEGET